MKSMKKMSLLGLMAGLLLTACSNKQPAVVQDLSKELEATSKVSRRQLEVALDPVAAGLPDVPREFRAAWVATVANIDWPSSRHLSVADQQAELIAILDKAAELNLNALVFQVRPSADAFYQSELEPWSEYLTGAQGTAPEPFYDPLAMWVSEAHKRGIELHVWFNPYRAWHPNAKGEIADSSIIKTNPDVVKFLSQGYWWMDPAEPFVQQRSLDVVMDVTERYDIDGVHFDDYFYPYTSYNNNEDFPDEKSWNEYLASGGTKSKGDWRRHAVNVFVQGVYEGVRARKSHVKVGMSPFGIWRPGHPPTIRGMDQYDVLYADAKLWLNEGWIDYWTPQLYWPIRQEPQSFPVLLGWWQSENTRNLNMWPGLGTYRAGNENWGDAREVLNQIQITRAIVPQGPGQVHFSFKTLQNDQDGVATALKNGPYRQKALVPPSPWLDSVAPAPPAGLAADSGTISWRPGCEERVFVWVVYRREGQTWQYDIIPGDQTSYTLPLTKAQVEAIDNIGGGVTTNTIAAQPINYVAVSAVDRVGNESLRITLPIQ